MSLVARGGGYDRYLYSQLNEHVREDVALYWYLFL